MVTGPGCQSPYDVTGRRAGTRARCRCGTTLRIPKVSDEAETLRCPGCSAPASPQDAGSSYCHAALAVGACPTSFGRVFVRSQHCCHSAPELGVRVDICEGAGIGADAAELGRIVQFVMNGRVDQPRRRELEQLEEQLKAKRAEIASMPTISPYEAPDGGDFVRLLDTIRDFFR